MWGSKPFALAGIFCVLGNAQARPSNDPSEIDENDSISFSGAIQEGTWTETFVNPDGSESLFTTTIEKTDAPDDYNEPGYGCYIITGSHTSLNSKSCQRTHFCVDGTVKILETDTYFEYHHGHTEIQTIPDGWFEEGDFLIGEDWKGTGNVVIRSVLKFKVIADPRWSYKPFQTTLYGFGAWRTDTWPYITWSYWELTEFFNEDNVPKPPAKATVDVITDGPGDMAMYQDGKDQNKPQPWVMEKGENILLTSDPSKTSQKGWVALASPHASGQFSSWGDGSAADRIVTVTMNSADPWLTATTVHAKFLDAPSTLFRVDGDLSDFFNGFSSSYPITFSGYTDQFGYTRFGRVVFYSNNLSYQLDVNRLVITPTEHVFDIDLDLDGSSAGGYSGMPVYNPTVNVECEMIKLSMGTDVGDILLVYIPAIFEYATDDNQILVAHPGFREYYKCGEPKDVIIDYTFQQYGIKTFPNAGEWMNEKFTLVSNGQVPISEHMDSIDPLQTREDPNYHWLFDFDKIMGSMNNDVFVGDAKDNVFWTNGGNDEATGNAGTDTFHLTGGSIMITDFAPSENDYLHIDRAFYTMHQLDPDYHTHDLVYYHDDGDLHIDIKSSGQSLVTLPGVTMSKSVWEQIWVENDLEKERYCIENSNGTDGYCRFEAGLDSKHMYCTGDWMCNKMNKCNTNLNICVYTEPCQPMNSACSSTKKCCSGMRCVYDEFSENGSFCRY
eukprot:Clim_evm2s206 gene=Clim_evmTU2s206